MHWRTALILTGVVAGLGALAWVRSRSEPPTAGLNVPLFEGLERERIQSFRIDNLERDTQLKLERDADGRWFLTDPIAYPADPSMVRALFEVVLRNRAYPAPDPDAAEVGLDPPRALLEVVEDAGGEQRRHRLELGAVDLGDQDVYVRVGGRILLTRRNCEGPLQHYADQYRKRTIVDVSLRSVLEVRRRGRLPEGAPDAGRTLELDARLTAEGWKVDRPLTASLDPAATVLLLQSVLNLRAESFPDDDAGGRLHLYGLDDPAITLELSGASGHSTQVDFGCSDAGAAERGEWHCRLRGLPQVFRVAERSVLTVATPVEDLLDYRISRAARDDVRSVELTSSERALRLVREGSRWLLSTGPPSGASPGASPGASSGASSGAGAGAGAGTGAGPARPADPRRVEDVLGVLESSEAVAYLSDATLEAPGDALESVVVETEAGQRWGGVFGAEDVYEGRAVRRFRREGEDSVLAVPLELYELTQLDPQELWSPVVHDLDPLAQRRIEISAGGSSAGGAQLVYERGEKRGLWFEEGGGVEAPSSFTTYCLDALLHLRAVRWLEGDSALEDPIEVTVVDKIGGRQGTVRFTLGRAAADAGDPRAALEGGGRVEGRSEDGAFEASADLYHRLGELLGR